MMKDFKLIRDVTGKTFTLKKCGKYITYSDTIYTWDIEVTSLFKIDGKYTTFDYKRDLSYYRDVDKVSLPYISMYGVEDIVYYSRNFYDIVNFMQTISDSKIRKILFIHNVSYEFQFFLNVVKKYNLTLTDMILRGSRKVITFVIAEYNLEVRCSYALTNSSLAHCAINYKCEHAKMVGDLDYNVARSPLTKLSKKELGYCENDIIVMYEFISKFRDQYGHTCKIPLTQTGRMRNEMKKHIDYYYIKKRHDLVPDFNVMILLMKAFTGGISHANFIHVDKVLDNVGSFDYSSDYPYQLCTQQFPKTNFFRVSESSMHILKDKCCFLLVVKLTNVKSRYLNHYISSSKCIDLTGARYDNGRLCAFNTATMCITDVDWDLIQQSYTIRKVEYLSIYASYKGYLEKEVIEFILDLYQNKTRYKGDEDHKDIYQRDKETINSTFGCAVTNIVKQRYSFDINDKNLYVKREITKNFIDEKLKEMKISFSTLFDFSTGVWVTAYARKSLWRIVASTDRDNVYNDTDSAKIKDYEKHLPLVDEINGEIYESIARVSQYHDIDINRFFPRDIKGKKHMLGELEFECAYNKFKTLGAKKYCYEDDDGLHITVAGVKKSAVKTLKSINDFKDGHVFSYDCDKQAIFYNDNQQPFTFLDCDGNEYTCDDIQYSIVIMPTEYKLSITPDFYTVLENLEDDIYY